MRTRAARDAPCTIAAIHVITATMYGRPKDTRRRPAATAVRIEQELEALVDPEDVWLA